jgi:F-type H+-transporting ATPase subunit epsilon
MEELHCTLVIPQETVFDGVVWQISIPGNSGMFGVRAGHAPLIATVKSGVLEIARTEKERLQYTVGEAIVEVNDNRCMVVADTALREDKS